MMLGVSIVADLSSATIERVGSDSWTPLSFSVGVLTAATDVGLADGMGTTA
ncbi:hypothetical protein GCM10008942_28710 [Rhizomicrobium electricum]|uniref:Uncharacterized protein n=1 Tax=Rhizomicrobium electricum TaxID=480070 RepID=A0ABN1EYX7_9PROT